MKKCPHCRAPIQFWKLWSAGRWTPYLCPKCLNYSHVGFLSRLFCALLGPLPVCGLLVYTLLHFDVSRPIAILIIIPTALVGSLLMGFLLAMFATFTPMGGATSSQRRPIFPGEVK